MNRNLFMKKLLLTTALLGTSILFTACSPAKKETTETTPASAPADASHPESPGSGCTQEENMRSHRSARQPARCAP